MLGPLKTRDTIRFVFPESRLDEAKRDYFVEHVLRKILRLGPAEVLCLLGYEKDGVYDLTMRTREGLVKVVDDLEANLQEPALKGVTYDVCTSRYLVIVQLFNPYVEEEDISLFLKKFCASVSKGLKVVDKYGLWTGKWKFFVQFVSEGGSLSLPPRAFALGPDRGHLYVPELPASVSCWACGRRGHQSKDCDVVRCDQCYHTGHVAKNCPRPKCCSLCGSASHLFRACPKRGRSYAGVASREAGGGSAPPAGSKLEEGKSGREKSHAAASPPKVKPHGSQDGGSGSGKRTKEAEKKVAPESRRAEGGGDPHPPSSSRVAETVTEAEEEPVGAGKRPLQEDEEVSSPERRPRLESVAQTVWLEESDMEELELESSDEFVEFADSGSEPPTPNLLAGWEERRLMETMGMAPPPPPQGEPPPEKS